MLYVKNKLTLSILSTFSVPCKCVMVSSFHWSLSNTNQKIYAKDTCILYKNLQKVFNIQGSGKNCPHSQNAIYADSVLSNKLEALRDVSYKCLSITFKISL